MSKPLAELYFEWLVEQIDRNDFGRTTRKTYWTLFRLLHAKEFVWTVANDDNRIADGLQLRMEFSIEVGKRGISFERGEANLPGSASVLEVLIGVSRRLDWETDIAAPIWAWQLIQNLELHKMSDPLSPRKVRQVDEILDRLIWRLYEHDGSGGLFPLAWPKRDQTTIEIWDQLCEYVMENQFEL